MQDWRGDKQLGDRVASHWHIEEVRSRGVVASIVCHVHHRLKSTNVIWISEVNDINGNIVLLQSHSQVFKVLLCSLSDGVTHEDNDSLSLGLVLSMLESKLSHLNRGYKIGLTVDLDVVDAVDQVTWLVGLSQSQLRSVVNQILVKLNKEATYLLPAMLSTPTLLSGFSWVLMLAMTVAASCWLSHLEGAKSPFRFHSELSMQIMVASNGMLLFYEKLKL